jgi:DNA-binding CsgD family transcriptional regulator
MDKALAQIDAQKTVATAIGTTEQEVARLGVIAATYHVVPPHGSQVGPNVFIAAFGHDPDWISRYRTPDFRANDPIPDFVMRTGDPMTFNRVLDKIRPNAAQSGFIAELIAAGQIDTMAIPVYGPFDFDTYATFTLGRPIRPDDSVLIFQIVALVEASNRRIAQLLERDAAQQIELSDREAEVLNWIGRSKSNGDIATILDIGTASVDTYVRRIFAKLDVNDRVSATLKGVRFGLIRF